MNVKFESRFAKDLKSVKDRNLLERLKQIILICKQAENCTHKSCDRLIQPGIRT